MRFAREAATAPAIPCYAIKPACWSGNSSITTLVIVYRVAWGRPATDIAILAYCLPTENYYLHCYTESRINSDDEDDDEGMIAGAGAAANQGAVWWWKRDDLPVRGDLRVIVRPKKSRASD